MADSAPTKPDGTYVRGGSAEALDSNLDYGASGAELPDREEFRGIVGSFAVLATRDDESARQLMHKFASWRESLSEKVKNWGERRRSNRSIAAEIGQLAGHEPMAVQDSGPTSTASVAQEQPIHTPQHQSTVEFATDLPAATRVWRERGLYRSASIPEATLPPSPIDDDMAAIMGIAAARVREELAQSNTHTAPFRQVPRQAAPPERESINQPDNTDLTQPTAK